MPQVIAAILDLGMLHRLNVKVLDEYTSVDDLVPVGDPIAELGSRYLIKYIRADSTAQYSQISGVTHFPGPHFLTPTPLTKLEAPTALNLPPLAVPVRALLLLPERLANLRGPRRVIGGCTIEYVCDSFDLDAIAPPQWAISL